MAKKTTTKPIVVSKSTVVAKKTPLQLSIKKETVVKAETKTVRVKPVAKTIEKSSVKHQSSRPGVRMAKKVQTAEGWKREAEKAHLAKKR